MEEGAFFGEDYHTHFDAKNYLKRFADTNVPYKVAPLKPLHDFYQSHYGSTLSRLKILDIGCGPVIAYVITAASYASEIVLSEYTASSRREITQWIHKDPSAHDWTPYFKYIVKDIEGKSDEEVALRQEKVRNAIKSVVASDFFKDPMMSPEYMVADYDIVQAMLCLEQSSGSKEDYVSTLKKMQALVKPGGKFLLYSQQKDELPSMATYHVTGTPFYFLRVSKEFVEKSLLSVGYSSVQAIPVDVPPCECKDGLCSFTLFIASKD